MFSVESSPAMSFHVLPLADPDFPKLQGLGWTGLELVFTVVQCLASIQLLQGVNRGDAQAIEAEISCINLLDKDLVMLVWYGLVRICHESHE